MKQRKVEKNSHSDYNIIKEKLEANPIVLHKVLISLRKIGLEKEARNLALEAAIASGL